MIIGLTFDIVGAFLIVKPVLYLIKKTTIGKSGDEAIAVLKREKYSNKEQEQTAIQKYALIGIIILVFGFGLQIVGNIIQYFND